jgi:hypothetical protein
MDIAQFKKTRAADLKSAARILQKNFPKGFNSSPILNAATSVENEIPRLKNGETNANLWGYNITDLVLPVSTLKHVRPKGIKNIVMTLDMSIIADFTRWGTINDPFLDMNFRVIIKSVGLKTNHSFGFHIDKHDTILDSSEPHPVYHLHYILNPLEDEDFEYGHTLNLDLPRIMHCPIDFILGIGFLISNFYPQVFDSIFDDGYFSGLYKLYQEQILKPYSHTLANRWEFDAGNIKWGPSKSLCPFLI